MAQRVDLSRQAGVRVQRALGPAGGAACVHNHRAAPRLLPRQPLQHLLREMLPPLLLLLLLRF